MIFERRTAAALAALALLAACGGGTDDAPAAPAAAARGARALASQEQPGSHCPSGGARIDAGIDLDGNGSLEAGEVTSTQYVCDGLRGTNGLDGLAGAPGASGGTGAAGSTALVQMSPQTAGLRCPSGGTRLDAGMDTDHDGVLDAPEVTSVAYVCAGAHGVAGAGGAAGAPGAPGAAGVPGAPGAAGTDGHDVLMRLVPEDAGLNCATAGRRITSGPDVNRNGLLDSAEVDATAYVCNGPPGPRGADGSNGTNGNNGTDGTDGTDGTNGTNGTDGTDGTNAVDGRSTLTLLQEEPRGPHCDAGGVRILSGLDDNRDDRLDDPDEVSAVSYVCHGPGGWVEAFVDTVQALPNTGYVATGPTEVSITLPVVADIGDVVRVSGASEGGWRIVPNPGQSIVTTQVDLATVGVPWKYSSAPLGMDYRAVASSADGQRLVAARGGEGPVVSADGGTSWTVSGEPGPWTSVASSADGSRLVLVGYNRNIQMSTNAGVDWSVAGPSDTWTAVASSADGRVLAAVAMGHDIRVSTDFGATWQSRNAGRTWTAVAMSADGSQIVAASATDGLDISVDSGVNWTTALGNGTRYRGVASSADGRRLVVVGEYQQILTSDDFGTSWLTHDAPRFWTAVASSADGARLVAVASTDPNLEFNVPESVHVSADGGLTWTARGPEDAWMGVASSADGRRLVAVSQPNGGLGAIATSKPSREVVTSTGSRSLAGGRYEAIELQYIGGDSFMVLDAIGASFDGE